MSNVCIVGKMVDIPVASMDTTCTTVVSKHQNVYSCNEKKSAQFDRGLKTQKYGNIPISLHAPTKKHRLLVHAAHIRFIFFTQPRRIVVVVVNKYATEIFQKLFLYVVVKHSLI